MTHAPKLVALSAGTLACANSIPALLQRMAVSLCGCNHPVPVNLQGVTLQVMQGLVHVPLRGACQRPAKRSPGMAERPRPWESTNMLQP